MPLARRREACAPSRSAAQAVRGDDYGGFAGAAASTAAWASAATAACSSPRSRSTSRPGVVKVERVVAVHDCGRPINPLAVESQIHGGIIQGLSYALYENRVLDRSSGWMLNANFETYKIAGAREIPRIEVHLIEEYRGRSSTDAGGIGEPATVATAGGGGQRRAQRDGRARTRAADDARARARRRSSRSKEATR